MEYLLVACPHCKKVNRLPLKEEYKKAVCGFCKGDLLKNRPIEITSPEEFDSIVGKVSLPVVIDFWAQWCGPCLMFAPTFKKVAVRYPLKANFLKIDIDRVRGVAERFDIRSIPTILILRDGREIDRVMGAVPEFQFSLWLDKWIGE
jgi:thioredoxin 2